MVSVWQSDNDPASAAFGGNQRRQAFRVILDPELADLRLAGGLVTSGNPYSVSWHLLDRRSGRSA
jgi:hypothetical protein